MKFESDTEDGRNGKPKCKRCRVKWIEFGVENIESDLEGKLDIEV